MAKYGINALVIGERIKQELKKQGKTSVSKINVSDLEKGNYIITAISKSGNTISKKFIKQ